MAKQERIDKAQPWPAPTKPHYINLFKYQEHMRAHLKLAQELAVHNLQVKYGGNPRKTAPIKIAGRQDDYLKEYQIEQLPKVRKYLTRMQEEIDEIKRAFLSGRHPRWYKQTLKVEDFTFRIWKKINAIEVNLILTESYPIKQSNESIIFETRQALEVAWDIRKELLVFRPEQTAPGLDEFRIFEIIIDLENKADVAHDQQEGQQHYMDLTPIWHRSQHKKTRG